MPRPRVVITDFVNPDISIEQEVFKRSGLEIDLRFGGSRSPETLIPLVADADALLVQFATIDRSVVDALTRCKVISRYGIGVDMIDIAAATERRIPVANVPDFCIDEVATQTIGFVIDLNRRTFPLVEHVRAGRWGTEAPACSSPRRLQGQTIGIVGLGAIGSTVARMAGCLGLEVIATDPFADAERAGGVRAELVGLDDLLRRADYVSLHCPLLPVTRGMIGAAQLAAMKPTAFLINMARGPVVDQEALVRALTKGTIAGAALDVLEQEPPAPDDPLLRLTNVLVTPHISSWSVEATEQLRRDTAQNVVEVLEGRLPRSVINRRELGL